MGYVYGPDSTSIVPFATVWIDYNGDRLGVKADVKGKFKISAVKPGKYNLHAEATLQGKNTLNGINVYSESIAKHNLYLTGSDTLIATTVVADPLLNVRPHQYDSFRRYSE